MFAGGELENYLRYLQTLGLVPAYPWGLRAFSPAELDRVFPRDTTHPWAARYNLVPRPVGGLSVDWVAPTVSARVNSTFPYGYNDGPIWAGKGITFAAQAGVAVHRGPVSLTLAPMGFVAQNAAFRLEPNGQAGPLTYADGLNPTFIDLPQRFGGSSYAQLDPGQSTVVAHAGVINAYLGDMLDIDRLLWVELDYAAICRVAVSRSGVRSVLALNERPHGCGLPSVSLLTTPLPGGIS